MDAVASISYGKDSLAMLHVITDVLGWPLDRIITAEVWATDTISADLPDMVAFKDEADRIILGRWGIQVEHFTATNQDGSKKTYEQVFFRQRTHSRAGANGAIYGWPFQRGPWCNSELKMVAIRAAHKSSDGCIQYIGIAADEPFRVERHKDNKNVRMPLVEAGWTEAMCRAWCEENGLLAPVYQRGDRGGCWFCHNQPVDELRALRKDYPELWAKMLEWDVATMHVKGLKKEKITYRSDGRTIYDYERRFQLEDEGYKPMQSRFRWDDVENAQMNIFQFLKGQADEPE